MRLYFVSVMITPFISIIFLCCTNSRADQKLLFKAKTDTAVYFPYSAKSSAGFNEGKPFELKMVLNIWRQYETGDVMNMSSYFADTVQMIFPDREIKGHKDTVLKKFS